MEHLYYTDSGYIGECWDCRRFLVVDELGAFAEVPIKTKFKNKSSYLVHISSIKFSKINVYLRY